MRSVFLVFLIVGGWAMGGFETGIDSVLKAAKKDKRPILISFYGIWCPPCNEMEETVFETTSFHKKAKAFHLLKVDADSPKSWGIKDKYKVGGYPTVIFTNANGEEIYRFVGYRSPAEVSRAMDLVLSAKGKDVSKACDSTSEDDLWRCGLICAERKQHDCATTAFTKLETKLKPGSFRYFEARTYFVEHAGNSELKRLGYEKLLAEAPTYPKALQWAMDYLDLFDTTVTEPAPKKELLEKVLAAVPQMRSDSRTEELGIPLTDILQAQATILAKLGRPEESKAVWAESATLLGKLASEFKSARGYTLERISCLREAGQEEAALKLANEYRTKYPEEFTFHFAAASLLKSVKKYNDAIPIAKRAYEVSYGDNRIRSATLLVDLFATVPDKESARKYFEEVTSYIKPDASLEVRTHRYLKKLKEAWAAIGTKVG